MNTQTQHTVSYVFSDAEIDQAVRNAVNSGDGLHKWGPEKRSSFLKILAEEIESDRQILIQVSGRETSLPEGRLNNELDRTLNQIRMFQDLLEDGSWVNAVIDTALPQRTPLPKPDIRQMQRPIGPVAVFGAGNFPFAFSVAGGDTIAALAAGCPVLYKVHPGHPVTSHLVNECMSRAIKKSDLPPHVFILLEFPGNEGAIRLVKHPGLAAIAFTGSLQGGRALFDTAVSRPEPIPCYAEMGSVNPVFLLPRKLKEACGEIAAALVASNTMGAGQFCTNPGIIVLDQSEAATQFVERFGALLAEVPGSRMLTGQIHQNYVRSIEGMKSGEHVKLVSAGLRTGLEFEAIPHAFQITGDRFLEDRSLWEECFGPACLLVMAKDREQMFCIVRSLQGQLTASVWATEEDCSDYTELFDLLAGKAGRVILNNAPTGVEVTHAMIHGGPYPATTDSRVTSVGTGAIYRFTRPVCYQNLPDSLLPAELQNGNPLGITRKINGVYAQTTIA